MGEYIQKMLSLSTVHVMPETLERILREGITSGVWTAYKMSETDIDDIPVLERIVDGDHLAVDLGADAFAPYVCMDLKSKIKRRGACRQFDDIPIAARRPEEFLVHAGAGSGTQNEG